MSLLLLLAAFVLTGLNSISNKALGPLGLNEYMPLYSFGFWTTGVILGLATLAVTKHEVRKQDAAVGVTMGIAGAVAMVLLLTALRTVPGFIAFPVRSCGNTTLTAIVSFLAWREQVSAKQWIGIACGLLAIYLIMPSH
jgi:drug/metabolite transporter (DMT)-like permease